MEKNGTGVGIGLWSVAAAMMLGAIVPSAAGAQAVPKAYATNCQMCHQAAGKGVPGLFPRLGGRVEEIGKSPEGRKWLLAVLLNGQSGRITVDGKPISGVMASFARLPDEDIAGVLTYLSHGKGKAFTAAEVAAARGGPKWTPAKVGEERARLMKAGVIK